MLAFRRAPVAAFAILGVVACAGESPVEPADPSPPAIRITRVEISPKANVTLPAAAVQRFSARVLWSDGQNRDASLVFEASDGSIDSTGSFKAPRRGGLVRVIARTRDGQAADTAIVGVTPPELSRISVAPKTATIEAQSRLQLSITALWSDGSDSLPSVDWLAPVGGTISTDGQYVAPRQAGAYTVIASHRGGTLRDTAFVTVAAPTLTRLTISPETLTMTTGGQHQFSAVAQWSDGSTTLPALSWSRLGAGSVTTTGRYTAPSNPGTNRVVVQHSGGTLRDTAVVTVVAPTVTSFRLTPESVRLQFGQSVQMTTSVAWSDGVNRAVSVSYEAMGGTVANGIYTAGQVAGTFLIIATCGCGAADTTAAVIENPVLQQIRILPKTVSLQTGATQTFGATARWSNDDATLPPVTYSRVGGGTINATTGLYTAPATPGSFLVIVAPQGSALRDTAFVTVSSDPPAGGGLSPNRPASFTNLVSDYGFSDVPRTGDGEQAFAAGWSQIYGGTLSRVEDPSAPISPPYALQWTFSPGPGGGGVGNIFRPIPAGKSAVYVAFSLWHDPNFEWNQISNKLLYWESGNIILQSRHWDDFLSVAIGAYDRVFNPNQARVPSITDFNGRWARIEILIQRGNPGRLQVWLNGALVSDHVTQVPTDAGVTELKLDSTWGGGGTRTRTSYRRIDHVLVATP